MFRQHPAYGFLAIGVGLVQRKVEYVEMIIAIYATLGVFLLIASRNPNHLYGDVPALFIIAAVLAFLSPEAFRLPFRKRAP
jgi:hypothetical protein